jgi:hypothetical protein
MKLNSKNLPKIRFIDFPPDLDAGNNVYKDAIEASLLGQEIKQNINFYGCYPNIKFLEKLKAYWRSKLSNKGMVNWLNSQQGIRNPANTEEFNIWVTFENRRAPHKNFDLTLSFDCDDYGDNNLYFPLIYQYMDIRGVGSSYAKHKISPMKAMQKRSLSQNQILQKNNFMVSFINNPHPIRLRAQEYLSKIDSIHAFGRSVDNYVQDKISTSEKYWFSLCFENDLYPGYVTEKVLEAWLGWTIPLYWGNDAYEILNPAAIINLSKFPSMIDFINYVENLYKDKNAMVEMINQPLLAKNFQYEDLVNFMNRGLKKKFAHE